MKRFSRREFLAGGLALTAGLSFAEDADVWSFAERAAQKRNVTGFSSALIKNGKLAETHTFGLRDVEKALPIQTETVFEAASLSKPAFGYCALQLVAEGKLKLDEPLLPYVKERFRGGDGIEPVTMRMVLSHTSGLPHGIPQGGEVTMQFKPGEKFAYSATGFTYLQRAVATITGQTIEQFMRERMFAPLGMKRSDFIWRDWMGENWAAGYDAKGKRGQTYLERFRNFSPEKLAEALRKYPELAYPPAAAGLYTTASDYARFLIEMISPQTGALKAGAVFEEMFKSQVKVSNKASWGLGWGLLNEKSGTWVWHWGNWNGLSQHFATVNRVTGDGLVLLTNSGNGLAFCKDFVPQAIGLDLEPLRRFFE